LKNPYKKFAKSITLGISPLLRLFEMLFSRLALLQLLRMLQQRLAQKLLLS
jgi:hypothetical protein